MAGSTACPSSSFLFVASAAECIERRGGVTAGAGGEGVAALLAFIYLGDRHGGSTRRVGGDADPLRGVATGASLGTGADTRVRADVLCWPTSK